MDRALSQQRNRAPAPRESTVLFRGHEKQVGWPDAYASETINTKLRELETDASGEAHPLHVLLEAIREFCVKQQRRNAFLVEITTDDLTFENVRKLVDLRLLHVINEGITIGEAGRKYLGLILDYGFYTGIRAARSVDLFNRQTKRVAYKDLRRLPVFEYSYGPLSGVQQQHGAGGR